MRKQNPNHLLAGLVLIAFISGCGSLTGTGSGAPPSPSVNSGENFSGACITANDCSGVKICVSSRTCIINILSTGCSCAGDPDGSCIDFTQTSHGNKACVLSGGTCFGGMAVCCQGLSCNNGTCEGPNGHCPFTLAQ